MVKKYCPDGVKESYAKKMSEIDDKSPEDQKELTFQASQPFDLSFRDEKVANEDFLFYAEAYDKWQEENDDFVRQDELKIVNDKQIKQLK